MRGGRIGGEGSMLKRALWVFFAACLVVAIWGDAFTSPTQVVPTMARKSTQIESTVKTWVAKVGLTTDGSEPEITVPKVTPSKDKGKPAPKK